MIYLGNRQNPQQKITELSCGWASLDLKSAQRDLTKRRLDVNGGSPTATIAIKAEELKEATKRTGIGGIFNKMGGSTTSHIVVSTKNWKGLEEDTKIHMKMLPSTCLVHKRLLHFVSGFRNYAARILLKESSLGEFKQPGGNVAISCFPAIIDNPDIIETLVACWTEDVVNTMDATAKKKVEPSLRKAEEYIQKLYPVLFSDDFETLTANVTGSACNDSNKLRKRRDLVSSALRFDLKKGGKGVPKQSIEEMTTFKPFNVREI